MRSTTGDHIPEDLPVSYNWNADNTINYLQVTDGIKTWRNTYTYSGGNLVSESGWVLQ